MDNGGCTANASYTVSITPGPTVNITAPTTSICTGNSLLLTANGASSYTWYPSASTATAININPSSTTVYSLVGTDASGCKDSTSATITVNTPPILSVVPSKTLVCFPDTVVLTASGATSYTWSTGATTSTLSVLVFANTNYSITGDNGCVVTKNYSLTGLPRPNVTITPSKPTICNGDTLTLKAFGASSYSWTTLQFINPIVVNPTVTTTYSVLGLGSNGCYNYAGIPIAVINGVNPTVNSSGELCIGKTITISANGAVTYTWNTGSNNQNFTVVPPNTQPLTYSVASTDANGCFGSANIVFNVSDKCHLVIYNGVTPNGDGRNDIFFLENIEMYPGNVVSIFNRWGQLLDEIHDYNNTNRFWAGTGEGGSQSVPSGTYYYVINLGNGTDLIKGWIELTKKDLN
jgi:gliding motility-associated-like protein